jgi:hypothetical protein
MITVACPHPQTVRTRTISHIPEQSPSSPEHAGALGSGCLDVALENGDLVSQDQDLGVFGQI